MPAVAALFASVALIGAGAEPPPEFRQSFRLQPTADALAPGTRVYCSRGEDFWRDDVTVRFPSAAVSWSRIAAYYEPTPNVIRLSPWACRTLEGWLRGKATPTLRFMGVYSLSFVHELMHARGIAGERDATCAALRALPGVLRTHLRVRKPAIRQAIVRFAWADNRLKPATHRC